MSANASKIAERIIELEKDVAKQHGAVARAEKAVADVYINKGDSPRALADLSNERAALAGMVQALTTLDGLHFETASAEHTAAIEAINSGVDRDYIAASKALKGAITLHVLPVVQKYGISGRNLEAFTNSTTDSLWALFNAKAADALRDLGPAPKAPPARRPDGSKEVVA